MPGPQVSGEQEPVCCDQKILTHFPIFPHDVQSDFTDDIVILIVIDGLCVAPHMNGS